MLLAASCQSDTPVAEFKEPTPMPITVEPQEPATPEETTTAPSHDTTVAPAEGVTTATEPGHTQTIQQALKALHDNEYNKALILVLDLPQDSLERLMITGAASYHTHSYETAKNQLKMALALYEPTMSVDEKAGAYKYLAVAHYDTNEPRKALAWLDKALSINPDPALLAFSQKVRREAQASGSAISESNGRFTVVFDGYEHAEVRRIVLDILEGAYRDIGRETGIYPDRPVSVVLYTNQQFYDVTLSPGWAGGVYDGKIRLPAGGLESTDRAELKRILYHEYVHSLVRGVTKGNPLPFWLSEGLAEYFSRTDRGATFKGKAVSLNRLQSPMGSASPGAVRAAYALSLEATAYLIDRQGLYGVTQMLGSIGMNKTFDDAFFSAFLSSFDDFDASWLSSRQASSR